LHLGLFSLGDVGQGARNADHGAVTVESGLQIDFNPTDLAVFGQKPGLVPAVFELAFKELQENVLAVLPIFTANVFEEELAERLLHLKTGHGRPGGAKKGPIAKYIQLDDDVFNI